MAGGRCGNFCLDFYVTLDGKGNLSSFLKAAWHERCSVGSSLATIWVDLMVLIFCNVMRQIFKNGAIQKLRQLQNQLLHYKIIVSK